MVSRPNFDKLLANFQRKLYEYGFDYDAGEGLLEFLNWTEAS